MPNVAATHEEYDRALPLWQRCSDVIEGEDAVKQRCWDASLSTQSGGTTSAVPYLRPAHGSIYENYLPRLEGQTDADYAAYLFDAELFNATARAVEGLVGAICIVEPELHLSPVLKPLEDAADDQGTPLFVMVRDIVRRVISFGRAGLLVDMPVYDQADAPPTGTLPYLCSYQPWDIINWRTEIINSQLTLTRVVLREEFTEEDPEDEYIDRCYKRYRVLSLAEMPDGSRQYQIELWRERKQDDGTVVEGDYELETEAPMVPVKQGKPLDRIPFVFFNPSNLDAHITRPPILGLVNVNLHHFRLSAKLNHGLMVIALPQPIVIGDSGHIEGEAVSYRIGSGVAWMLPMNADAKYLEFTGSGVQSIKDEMTADEARMVLLGARLLESQKRAAETAEALRLRQAGETATLATIADTVSWGMSLALGYAADWVGANPKDNAITLNQEFTDTTMSEDEALSLMKRWQGGLATLKDCYELLKQGGRIEKDITYEEWAAKLEDENASQQDQLAAFLGGAAGNGTAPATRTGNGPMHQAAGDAASLTPAQ